MSQAVSTSGSLLSVIVNPGSGSSAECGVTYVESLDLNNPVVLRELDSGSYVLYGKFKAYSGDDTIIAFESKLNANIVKSTDRSSVMIFNPVNSKVECLTIYNDSYERNDVALQDTEAILQKSKTLATSYPHIGYLGIRGNLKTETTNFFTSDYFAVEEGAIVRGAGAGFKGNTLIYAIYDENLTFTRGYKGNPINGEYGLENFSVDIKKGERYIRLCTHKSYANESYVEINWNACIYTDAKIRVLRKELADSFQTIFYVGYGKDDGKNYYNSLVDCLWAASLTNGYKTIHISDGVYDVLNELGGMEHIYRYNKTDNTPYDYGVQPWINDCKIIGHGNVVLTFLLDDDVPTDNYWLFSCLNVRGNITIENIEIRSKNCRYAIHDESGNDYTRATHVYKNVRCYQNVGSGVKGGQVVGCGFSDAAIVYIDGCYFEHGTRNEVWTCHANKGCSFVINNTVFKGTNGTHSLRISQNCNTIPLQASISNCYITNGISVRSENSSTNVKSKTKIVFVNTRVPNVLNGYGGVLEPIISYDTIAGTETVLLATTE